MSDSQTGFTYLHRTARDLLAPLQVLPDYIFGSAETCRSYMARCLHDPKDHVVLEGTWDHNPEDWQARTTFTPLEAVASSMVGRRSHRKRGPCASRGSMPTLPDKHPQLDDLHYIDNLDGTVSVAWYDFDGDAIVEEPWLCAQMANAAGGVWSLVRWTDAGNGHRGADLQRG